MVPLQTTSPRYPALDALRVVAMMDIVSIHVTGFDGRPPRYLFWGMGLPVFIMAAVALSVRRPESPTWRGLPAAARKRAERVLLPWLVWSIFFGVVLLVGAALRSDRAAAELFYPGMWVAGPSVHLWFLPFIFVAELVVLGVLHPLRRVPTLAVVAGAVALGVGCILWTGAVYDRVAADYWAISMVGGDYAERAALYGWTVRKSWLFGTASVCLGVAVGRTLSVSTRASPRRWLLAGALGLFLLYFVWAHAENPPIHGHAVWQWWRQCFALLLVALAVQFTGPTPAWLMRVAVLTMGIYLLHDWTARRLGELLGLLYDTTAWRVLWPIGGVMHHPIGKVAVVWLLTAALVALLRRSAAMRRVL